MVGGRDQVCLEICLKTVNISPDCVWHCWHPTAPMQSVSWSSLPLPSLRPSQMRRGRVALLSSNDQKKVTHFIWVVLLSLPLLSSSQHTLLVPSHPSVSSGMQHPALGSAFDVILMRLLRIIYPVSVCLGSLPHYCLNVQQAAESLLSFNNLSLCALQHPWWWSAAVTAGRCCRLLHPPTHCTTHWPDPLFKTAAQQLKQTQYW